jgi:hypothetical protein
LILERRRIYSRRKFEIKLALGWTLYSELKFMLPGKGSFDVRAIKSFGKPGYYLNVEFRI